MSRMAAYAIRVAMLLLHLPHAEHTAEQVAAPQQLAPKVRRVPIEGTARSGSDRSAPIVAAEIWALGWWWWCCCYES